jgi:DNA-binding Xre family transcriptional regulator
VREVRWRLPLIMRERGMRAPELAELLAAAGVVRSASQVFRLASTPPKSLSLCVLSALCEVLDREPGDLLVLAPVTTGRNKARLSLPPDLS